MNSLPDASKWGYEVGGNGWGNNELEYYKDSDPDNSSMDGQGNLRITVRAEPFGGSNYTSARIRTQGKFDFLYGTMEARIKIPAGSGLWPAFWTLGTNNNPSQPDVWPNLGEIDVMEAVNSDKGYSATTHAGPSDWSKYKYSPIPARDGAFHIYSAKWSPGTIAFYVDGTLVTTVTKSQTPAGHTWPFDSVHQYLLLNVAMGGNYPGAPDGSAVLPATMLLTMSKSPNEPALTIACLIIDRIRGGMPRYRRPWSSRRHRRRHHRLASGSAARAPIVGRADPHHRAKGERQAEIGPDVARGDESGRPDQAQQRVSAERERYAHQLSNSHRTVDRPPGDG